MIPTPLFIIFLNSNISIKLINLIKIGKIHAIIYCSEQLTLKVKKVFSTITKSFYQIHNLNLPFTYISFNFILTSKSFWDSIPLKYSNIFVLYNPKGLALSFNLKYKYETPFFLIPMDININLKELIRTNTSLLDEVLQQGFFFYINNKFGKNTIKYFTKKQILNNRKINKMLNNEFIERSPFTSFYLYFIHYSLELGYNF